MSSPPLSPNGRPSPNSITRTVAIIKNHALGHRFDIERRIQEASFEVGSTSCLWNEFEEAYSSSHQIVKERQMEFDVESDPETLYELFGEDADSLGE